MPDAYTILLNAPDQPTTKVQIAKLGDDFHHARYGDFRITAEEVADWKRNLSKLPGGRALIDQDHQADKTPRRTEASGWITDVDLEDGVPMATVEWTPRGEKAIRDKEYLFLSPSFGPFENEKGERFENTLQGAALTNRPHLQMPALQLASEDRVSRALLADPESGLYQLALDGALGEDVKALAGVTQDERDAAHAEGNSLDDKSYPIRNVGQLKAAITLAQSGHGDVAAAKKLIIRRAKELGREDLLPDGWGTGKTLEGSPSETTQLLDRNAAELIDSDSETMLRVLKGLETVLGITFMDADERWHTGAARVNRQASVAELLEAAGLDREQISQVAAVAATLEANAAAERQKIADAAPLAERDRVYAGQMLGVPEAVYLAPDFDHGTMAEPPERARRLARARANDIGGIYAGDKGAERFHAEDKEAVELGLDLPRSLERRTEIAGVRAIQKGETGGALPQIAATTARTEARTLENDIADIDRRVEAEDRERVELRRRKVWRGGLDSNSGALLALRREKTIALDDLKQSRAIRLENIPGYKIALDQPTGWRKLLASELAGAGPASPFDPEAVAAERMEIDRRARLYLLDHQEDDYGQALDAVEADRDRPAPEPPPTRTPTQAQTGLSSSAEQLDREAKTYMFENACGFMEALEAVERADKD